MLTPEEIRSREFLVELRGYDRDQVRAFLDEVAAAFSKLAGGRDEGAGDEPGDAGTQSSLYADVGVQTQRILDAAQAAGEEIRRRARADAEAATRQTVEEARAQVEALETKAEASRQQIDLLEQRGEELAQRLRQARETVDVALLEMTGDLVGGPPVDATNSVLAAQAEDAEPEPGRSA